MNYKLHKKHIKYKSYKQSHFDGGCGHLSQTRAYVEGGIKQASMFLQGIFTNWLKSLEGKALVLYGQCKPPYQTPRQHCIDPCGWSASKQSRGQLQVKTPPNVPNRHILGFSSRSAMYYIIQHLVSRF